MNCDDVFVILTRGPFPSGSPHDDEVEAHLLRCPDCHRLAEALRPNDQGPHDSIGLNEGGALPGYWGEALGTAGDLAISLSDAGGKSSLKRLPRRSTRALPMSRNLNVWQFAAAVALGIVVAAALRTLVASHPARSNFFSTVEASDGSGEGRRGVLIRGDQQPSLSDLPAICRGVALHDDDSKMLSPISAADVATWSAANCCTDCHHSGSTTKISDSAKIRLEQSCQACHG
jgi:hypothetical protein